MVVEEAMVGEITTTGLILGAEGAAGEGIRIGGVMLDIRGLIMVVVVTDPVHHLQMLPPNKNQKQICNSQVLFFWSSDYPGLNALKS